MSLPVNTLLQGGKYKIVRFISSGGFGCTYEAEHVMLEKRVAIKEFFVKDFCNRDENTAHVTIGTLSKKGLVEKLRRKFIDEAKALCKLQHPGIVSVQDVFEENGTAYFVMDYVDGKSLSEIVKEQGPLPEERAVRYIRQVATALQYVHDNNRLHLDIKPGNIMIDGNDNPVLIDFGASKQYDEEDGENTSTLMGKTPGYAPLEQMGNDVVKFTPATDIYALGATLYKLLTGITPTSANLLACGETLEPLPTNISAATRNAIAAAMEINKNKRPKSLAIFMGLLQTKPKAKAAPTEDTVLDDTKPIVPKVSAKSTTARKTTSNTKRTESKEATRPARASNSTEDTVLDDTKPIEPKVSAKSTTTRKTTSNTKRTESKEATRPARASKSTSSTEPSSDKKSRSYIGIIVGIIIVAVLGAGAYWSVNQWREAQWQAEVAERRRLTAEQGRKEAAEQLRLYEEQQKKETEERLRLAKEQQQKKEAAAEQARLDEEQRKKKEAERIAEENRIQAQRAKEQQEREEIEKKRRTQGSTSYYSGNYRTIYSKEATIKVGERIVVQLPDGYINRWEINQTQGQYLREVGDGSITALREGSTKVWGYINNSPKFFHFTIVGKNTYVPADRPPYQVSSKVFTMYTGDQITAKLSDGVITRWEINSSNSDYISADGNILKAKKKAGTVMVWGYAGDSPKFFTITIKPK